MNYRTTCQEHNDIGFAEAMYDDQDDNCPRCDGRDYEEEECCTDCRAELDEWAQEFAAEDRITHRAESGWG